MVIQVGKSSVNGVLNENIIYKLVDFPASHEGK